jgi:hypothetical protein
LESWGQRYKEQVHRNPRAHQGKIIFYPLRQHEILLELGTQETRRYKLESIEHGRREENVDSHQKSTKRICAGSLALLEESAKLGSLLGLSYPIITKESMACNIQRIGW